MRIERPESPMSVKPWVRGEERPASAAADLVDPTDASVWGEVQTDVDAAHAALESAAESVEAATWRGLPQEERTAALWRLAEAVERHAGEFAAFEVLATGKTARTTSGEAARMAKWLRFYAGAALAHQGRLIELGNATSASITHEPIGVVVAITPFNGALSLGMWKMAPALAMGNSVILKPPIETPVSAALFGKLAGEAGLPPGVLNVVPGGADVGEALVRSPEVGLVSFTGSTAVAGKLGALAGGGLKRFLCEAGGKSAQLVFADADLDKAVRGASGGVFGNTGQTCVAGSRILVHRPVWDEFMRRFVESARALKVGDPFEPDTDVGPLAHEKQFSRVRTLVDEARARGRECLTGGARPAVNGSGSRGFYYDPTVFVDLPVDDPLWRDEVFGPVVGVRPFEDEDEAVALANDSSYGLAAGLWTSSLSRAARVSRALEAGTVWVNTYRRFDYRAPFGGYKQSGVGRENGVQALEEFANLKTTIVDATDSEAASDAHR